MTNTSNDPNEIRAEIEQTRANLSDSVNALGEAVSPSAVAQRQVDKVKGMGVGLKDKVMGSAQSASSSVGDRASDVGQSLAGAPDTVKAKAQGNPLAAGLVALGIGWLAGSLLPASAKEREAAAGVKEKAQPAVQEAKQLAMDSAQRLQEPAKEAVASVKDTVQEAAETVKAEGRDAATDVKQSAKESADSVKEHQQRPDTSL